MQADLRVLGIILARKGSKGLPGKNTMTLRGKPLIAWSIQAGLESHFITDVVVSTDGAEIASIAQECGAEVPFIRPAHLATDTSTSADAIMHAISFLHQDGRQYDYVILLEPTSPIRSSTDIDGAISSLVSSGGSALVSVCRASTVHPSFMFTMGIENLLSPYETSRARESIRRQDVDDVFYPDGSIYVSSTQTFESEMSFYHEGTLGYEMPRWKSLEIDDELDFLLVEAVMRDKGIV
jgi:CMP-N,N'-diacetyllegionaminic acid synthase